MPPMANTIHCLLHLILCLWLPAVAAPDAVTVLLFAVGVRGQPPALLPGMPKHRCNKHTLALKTHQQKALELTCDLFELQVVGDKVLEEEISFPVRSINTTFINSGLRFSCRVVVPV